MKVQAGSTACRQPVTDLFLHLTAAVISGARAFQLFTPEEQEFALKTTVKYAPRAYEWMRDCKATSDGPGIAKVGNERALDELAPWTWDKVQAFPNQPAPEKPY